MADCPEKALAKVELTPLLIGPFIHVDLLRYILKKYGGRGNNRKGYTGGCIAVHIKRC